jgi:hypothetical protein
MYKAQFKRHNPYEAWTTIGTYGSEQAAMSAAMSYKNKGMIVVRVVDKSGSVIYSN